MRYSVVVVIKINNFQKILYSKLRNLPGLYESALRYYREFNTQISVLTEQFLLPRY